MQFIVETSGTLLPHHKSGRLRIISLMADAREKISADIPTAREEGYDLIAGTYNLLARACRHAGSGGGDARQGDRTA